MTIRHMLVAATALATLSSPALAADTDKLLRDQINGKVAAAKADPALARHGAVQLEAAEAAARAAAENIDDDDVTDTRSISTQVDTLIEAAKVRSQLAGVKDEIRQLETDQVASVAAKAEVATARAETAEARAAAATAQNAALRGQLRDYQMKQTQAGATLVLQDVIFETGKATLRPGATQRLQPLVSYLTANPAVQVQIAGHTDSEGATAYNQNLSNARASAVRTALGSAGIDAARVVATGYGEARPIATNATVAGRQQNRRVEITLVGQQASQLATLTN